MPPARDSGGAFAVERGAIGAADTFDGNFSNQLTSWMFPNDNWATENAVDMIEELMHFTYHGHLAWCVFPPFGFRL